MNCIHILKKPQYNRKTKKFSREFTRIWTAIDRNKMCMRAFKIGDGTKWTYLKLAKKLEKHVVKHICTDGNKAYRYYTKYQKNIIQPRQRLV